MRLTIPDRDNLALWTLLAVFGGTMLVLAWIEVVVGR
jgi:hypothetical protein